MTGNQIIDILENTEFGLHWNEDKGKEFRKRVLDLLYENNKLMVQNDFLEERQSRRWIPCSERLPVDGIEVLIQTERNTFWTGWHRRGTWHTDQAYFNENEVLAWMPLPEPYQGGGSDD